MHVCAVSLHAWDMAYPLVLHAAFIGQLQSLVGVQGGRLGLSPEPAEYNSV